MYDELVKRLRAAAIMSEALSIFLPHSEGSAVAKLYNEAADAIEELQADKAALNGTVTNLLEQIKDLGKPRWIPVTERLPEECDFYLCWYEYYHVSKNKILPEYGIGYYDSEMHFWGGEVRNGRGAKVLAWMPLPEPPKEE